MINPDFYTVQHIELEVEKLDIDEVLKTILLTTLERYSELKAKLAEIEKKSAIGYIYTQGLHDLNNIGAATIYKEQQKFILSAPQRETAIYVGPVQQAPLAAISKMETTQ